MKHFIVVSLIFIYHFNLLAQQKVGMYTGIKLAEIGCDFRFGGQLTIKDIQTQIWGSLNTSVGRNLETYKFDTAAYANYMALPSEFNNFSINGPALGIGFSVLYMFKPKSNITYSVGAFTSFEKSKIEQRNYQYNYKYITKNNQVYRSVFYYQRIDSSISNKQISIGLSIQTNWQLTNKWQLRFSFEPCVKLCKTESIGLFTPFLEDPSNNYEFVQGRTTSFVFTHNYNQITLFSWPEVSVIYRLGK